MGLVQELGVVGGTAGSWVYRTGLVGDSCDSMWLKLPSGYLCHSHGKSQFSIGKPSINGPFSMAMLNSQRVYKTIINPPFGNVYFYHRGLWLFWGWFMTLFYPHYSYLTEI